MATDEQRSWVLRVLGIQSDSAPITAKGSAPVLGIWTQAKDDVDEQLNQLLTTMRSIRLRAIVKVAAEIEAATTNFRVGLTTALMNYESAPAGAKERARVAALKVVNDYSSRLPSDKYIAAIDSNPFKVATGIRATFETALTRLREALQP